MKATDGHTMPSTLDSSAGSAGQPAAPAFLSAGPASRRRALFGAAAAAMAAGAAIAVPTVAEAALPAPTGAVYALGLRFSALCEECDKLDDARLQARGSAKYADLDAACAKCDAACFAAFDGAMTTRARTSADALVQAVHAFDRAHSALGFLPEKVCLGPRELACDVDPIFWIKMELENAVATRADLELLMGALASLIAFLEPLAGLKADAFGWPDMPKYRTAALVSLGGKARP